MQETRSNENISLNERRIEGYAIVIDSISEDLGGFREIVRSSALDNIIEKNDVIACLEHNGEKVLARSRYGKGSLTLEVDQRGLKYSFFCPKSALGEDLLESVSRGDICNSSFRFVCGEERWSRMEDGTPLREIITIKKLIDVSPVAFPAYSESSVVCARGLDILTDMENKEIDALKAEIEALKSELESRNQEPEKVEEPKEEEVREEPKAEDEEKKSEPEEEKEENTSEDPKSEEEQDEEQEDERSINEETINQNNTSVNTTIKMKEFSLLRAINDIANHRSLDEVAQKVNEAGKAELRKSGLGEQGNITIPIEMNTNNDEMRANGILAQTAGAGQENVAEDKLSILEPLRANLILSQAGATYLTGLVGDVSIPVYSGSNCGWKGEIESADNGAGDWSEVVLQPKRLTAYLPISRTFLAQDGNGAEEMLRNDLIRAISQKLEETIFGDEAGSATKPEGFFNGIVANTTATKWENVVDYEAELEEKNVNNYVYVMSPSAKAIFRKTQKDAGSGRFVMEDNEIQGRNVYISSNVESKGVIVGDFSDYVVGVWGGISLIVDEYTLAAENQIRLVVHFYVDAKKRRDSFVAKILK